MFIDCVDCNFLIDCVDFWEEVNYVRPDFKSSFQIYEVFLPKIYVISQK